MNSIDSIEHILEHTIQTLTVFGDYAFKRPSRDKNVSPKGQRASKGHPLNFLNNFSNISSEGKRFNWRDNSEGTQTLELRLVQFHDGQQSTSMHRRAFVDRHCDDDDDEEVLWRQFVKDSFPISSSGRQVDDSTLIGFEESCDCVFVMT